MKDRKRFLIVFAIFWVIGLVGGYYLGVGSALLPSETVEYNYFFSEKSADSTVEPIKHTRSAADDTDEDNDESGLLSVLIEKSGLKNLPDKLVDWVSPQ
jgi:hypothetical protein